MKFVIGGTLTILSWDNPVTAFFRKSKKLRHSLGRPSRSDFVQLKVVKMMADIVYRMAEKSVDEASAWYEYQPEVPEKLKQRNSCKQS